jgi:ribosome recycling factor
LNEERRKELVKHLHTVAEDHRVSLRNIRRDANDGLKKLTKDKAISEDDERRSLDEVQKLTDVHMKKMDELFKTKEKEVLEFK